MLSTCHALLAHTVLTAGVVASIGAAARASNRIGTSEPSAPHKHARTSNRRSGLAGPRLAASACSAQPSWGPGPWSCRFVPMRPTRHAGPCAMRGRPHADPCPCGVRPRPHFPSPPTPIPSMGMCPAPRAHEIRREDANRPTTAPGSSRDRARPLSQARGR
jgi:hypothetical protein